MAEVWTIDAGAVRRMGTQNLPDNHKELLIAMRAADADAAAAAIAADVRQGMDQLRASLDEAAQTSDLIDKV